MRNEPASARGTTKPGWFRSTLFRWMRFSSSVLPMPWPELCDFSGFRFHAWLLGNPWIAQKVTWHFWDLGSLGYPDWPREHQLELELAFWRRGELDVADPPPNIAELDDDDRPRTVLAPADAWNLYKVTVAHVLAAEFADLFSWSLSEYSDDELLVLLDGRWMLTRNEEAGGYEVHEHDTHILPSPPGKVYPFLVSNGLIGATRLETISRLTDWCRQNMKHYVGGREVIHFEYNWQYRGYPPVSRIIERTPITNPDPDYQDNCVVSRTAGCWGTTGFYMAVLRLANIPVMRRTQIGFEDLVHQTPYFPSEKLWLGHGDDPYHPNTLCTPPCPASEILIDEATFLARFGPDVPDFERKKNLSRQVGYELVVRYWPDYTLRTFCQDLAEGRTGHDSRVYQSLIFHEPIDDATWELYKAQMQQKIDGFGGCDAVPEDHRFDAYCE